MEITDPDPRATAGRARLCLGLLAILFVALTIWSWRKWTDPQVDFGLQLYIPWQLAQGKVLYRDVWYIAGGPLSQYYHALLFKVFGPSYSAIAISNLCIAWLFIWGLFRLFLRPAGLLGTTAIGLFVMCVNEFSHMQYIGNFNFITPYTAETVHGLALSALVIGCLCRWLAEGRRKWLVFAGLVTGGVFMTKPDVFVALAGVLVVAAFVREVTAADGWLIRGRNLAAFLGAALAPVVLFVAYFASVWPTRDGWLAAAGAWTTLLSGRGGRGPYYKSGLGLDVPWENLSLMCQYAAAFLVIVGALAVAARFYQRGKPGLAAVVALLVAGFLFSPLNTLEWTQCGRALPVLASGGMAWSMRRWWLVRRDRGEELVFPMFWSVFAFLMLAKMGLRARLMHYGFYLSVPASVMVLYMSFRLVPDWLASREVNPRMLRVLLALFFGSGVVQLACLSGHYYHAMNFSVGAGRDQFWAYGADYSPAGKGVADTVDWLEAHTSPTNTIAVFPEGAMVNYLARRENPTRYLITGPVELQVIGESNVASAFVAHPPDHVLLWHEGQAYGWDFFGRDERYGLELMQWIKDNNTAIWLFGSEPLVSNQFGMKMFKRNEGSVGR